MTADSDDDCSSSEDNLLDWQIVSTKRKKSIKTTNSSKKQKSGDDIPSCSSINKFSELANNKNDNDDDVDDNEAELPSKPPPIFINNVNNISKMIKCVSSVIANTEFNYKALSDGQVKLNIKSVDSYRKLVKYFDANNLSYHTYQLKTERSFRFVIKGLHYSTKIEDIKADLIYKGHLVRHITNVKSRFTKQPLPMFYVDVDPSNNNKKVYEIREINQCIVQIEPPKSTNDIIQCHRCQEFGHSKTYCRKSFVCVKCGLGHPTTNCPKDIETPPKCVHCLKQHTASYRGCEVYQNLLKKKLSDKRFINQQYSVNRNNFPPINHNISYNYNSGLKNGHSGESYANVASQNINENIMKNIENLLNKQIELTNTLMNMMSLLINKLCK